MLYVRETIVGPMAIGSDGEFITHLYLPKNTAELVGFGKKEPPVVKEAFRQLELYLAGNMKKFDLPLKAEGTPS